jgi:hypothetical protein
MPNFASVPSCTAGLASAVGQ